MSTELTGVFFAIGTATAFGLGSAVARLGLIGTPVVTGTVVSMIAGTTLIVGVAAPGYASTVGGIPTSGWALIVFTSIINYPIGRLLVFNAMLRIGVARGNTIVSANPVVAGTIAIIWLGEVLGLQTGAGMIACVGGGVLVAWAARQGPSADESALAEDPRLTETTKGLLAALGAMLSYGTVSALVKKIVTDVAEPIIGASLVFAFGTVMVAMLSLPRLRTELPQITFRRGWQLVLGGSGMSLGVLMFYNAASRAPITAVAPVVALAPIIAILFSQVIARRFELVDKRIWGGSIAVVVGVALIGTSF